jgi:hypothetical protein
MSIRILEIATPLTLTSKNGINHKEITQGLEALLKKAYKFTTPVNREYRKLIVHDITISARPGNLLEHAPREALPG